MTDTNTCFCCVTEYNKSSHQKVICPYYVNKKKCNFHACKKCVKKYILESNCVAQCMSCKHKFSRDFLINNLSRTWVDNEYKVYLTEILFNTEKVKSKDNIKEAIYYRKISHLMHKNIEYYTLKTQLLEEVYQINEKIYKNKGLIKELEACFKSKQSIQLLKKCINSNCNGFFNANYICELCETKICPKCYVEIKEQKTHICSKNDIKTIQLLQTDSKNCPNCGECIFKVDGCDQMWCTQCKIAWDWKTQKIIYGKIHNPHFMEYQKKINNGIITRDISDFECNLPVPLSDLWDQVVCNTANYGTDIKQCDKKLFENILPVIHQNYVKLTSIVENRQLYLQELHDDKYSRIKYIVGETDENEFKKKIFTRNIEIEKWTDIVQLYELFEMICKESLNRIYYYKLNNNIFINDYVNMIRKELLRIRNSQLYINRQLFKISFRYKHSVHIFDRYLTMSKILISSKDTLYKKLHSN